MTLAESWLVAHTAAAPEALRERVRSRAMAGRRGLPMPNWLATSAMEALESSLAQGTTRAAALDLLAADGLVTLALLAQAEAYPAGLAAFARSLMPRPAP